MVKIQSAIFENAEQSLDIAWQMEQDFEQLFGKSAGCCCLEYSGILQNTIAGQLCRFL